MVRRGPGKIDLKLTSGHIVDVPKPRIIEDRDVILKVSGTTICGSDLHLLHGTPRRYPTCKTNEDAQPCPNLPAGTIIQLNKGDILGHEFCGVVDEIGPAVKNVKVGKRYVASFQIACGEASWPDPLSLPFCVSAPLTSFALDSAFTAGRSSRLSARSPTRMRQ